MIHTDSTPDTGISGSSWWHGWNDWDLFHGHINKGKPIPRFFPAHTHAHARTQREREREGWILVLLVDDPERET